MSEVLGLVCEVTLSIDKDRVNLATLNTIFSVSFRGLVLVGSHQTRGGTTIVGQPHILILLTH
jgi:hypothetical protein